PDGRRSALCLRGDHAGSHAPSFRTARSGESPMRLLVSLIGAAALYVLAEMGRQIIQREYPLWAPRLAHRLVQIAGALCPGRYREVRRREWLTVLRAYQEDGGSGILWAFTTLGYLPGLCASSIRTLSVHRIKASQQQSAPAARLQPEAD